MKKKFWNKANGLVNYLMSKCKNIECTFYGTEENKGFCSTCLKSLKSTKNDKFFTLEKHTHQYKEQTLREVVIFDQWSDYFKLLIKKYQTPSAICGYLSITIAFYLSEFKTTKIEEIDEAILKISNSKDFLDRLENTMNFIQSDRKQYIEKYALEFKSESEINRYITDWVANYEISDYIKEKKNSRIHFVRGIERNFNDIDHEEKRRVDEEIPFRSDQFFMDVSKEGLKSSKDWKESKYIDPIFIVDLGGHFGVAIPFEKSICLINTMESKYLNRKIMEHLFDMLYE